ncbi:hypothetical protein [Pseudomonas sp. TMP9]|uniref:hypothetical protein n=1 Tax=Pseudomonas sp. TMP9 TaxID=3133144 RepID=UPI0030D3F635
MRFARQLGWAITWLILFTTVLALGWKIAQVTERRALEATHEHLTTGLNNLVAEQMAKNQVLDKAWRNSNPFVLLRWQQDNYCGELAAAEEPQSGCWYWLTGRAWVLYQQRFSDEWANETREVRAWRLVDVPGSATTASHSKGTGFALELAEISADELSAAGY